MGGKLEELISVIRFAKRKIWREKKMKDREKRKINSEQMTILTEERKKERKKERKINQPI